MSQISSDILERLLNEEKLKRLRNELAYVDNLLDTRKQFKTKIHKEKIANQTRIDKLTSELVNKQEIIDKLTSTLANKSTILEQYITLTDDLASKCTSKHKAYNLANKQLRHYTDKNTQQKEQIETLIAEQNHLQTQLEQFIQQSTENEMEHITMVDDLNDTINNYRNQHKQNQSHFNQLTKHIRQLENEAQLYQSATENTTINQNKEQIETLLETQNYMQTNMEQIMQQANENEIEHNAKVDHLNSTIDKLHSIITQQSKQIKCLKSTPSQKTADISATHDPLAMGNKTDYSQSGVQPRLKTAEIIATYGQLAVGNENTNYIPDSNIAPCGQLATGDVTTNYSNFTKPTDSQTLSATNSLSAVGTVTPELTSHKPNSNNHQATQSNDVPVGATCSLLATCTPIITSMQPSLLLSHINANHSNLTISQDSNQASSTDSLLAGGAVTQSAKESATCSQLATCTPTTSSMQSRLHPSHITTNHTNHTLEGSISLDENSNTNRDDNRIVPFDQMSTGNSMKYQEILIGHNALTHQIRGESIPMLLSSHNMDFYSREELPSLDSRPRQLSGDLKWDTTFDFNQCQTLSNIHTAPLRIRHSSLGIYEDIFVTSKLNSHIFKTPDKTKQKSNATAIKSPVDLSDTELSISPLNLTKGTVHYRPLETPNVNHTHRSLFKNHCTLVPVITQADDEILNRTCWM